MSGDNRTVKVTFLGDAKRLAAASKQASDEVSKVGERAHRTGTALRAGLGVAAAATGVAVVGFVKSSISAASDLNESLSKTRTVFGSSSKSVEDFAATAAKNLGTSKQAALEATSTFGNLFTALQFSKPAAASMSTSLVKLAGDLGSFNNVDTETALEALRSGMLGEAEPLRKFGVSLSAARIQAEALSSGIVKPVRNTVKLHDAQVALRIATDKAREALKKHGKGSTEVAAANARVEKAARAVTDAMKGNVPELTAAQKAQAAYKVILEDTKTAQGDFSRTSGGLANQTKIAKARFDDLQSTIGTKLLPALNKGMELGLKTADWLGKNKDIVVPLVGALVGFAAAVWTINKATAAWAATQKALAVIFPVVEGEQWSLNAAMDANPIGIVVIAIAALAAGLIYAYKHSKTFREIVNGAFSAISAAASFMWNKVLKPTFKFLVDTFLSVAGAIVHGASWAFGWVPGIGGKLKDAAKAFDKFRDDVNASLGGIKDKTVAVKIDARQVGQAGHVDLHDGRKHALGTRGAMAGMALVGEHGPELVEFRGGERVHTAQATRSMGGSESFLGAVQLVLDGRVIQTALLRLKREGGGELGLA